MKQNTLQARLAQLPRVLMLTAVTSLALVACGGGGNDDPQLSGTAAIGAPVAGATVQARCAGSGSTLLESITSANGTWQINAAGQSLPCAVRVSGGNLAAGQALHSVALDFSNVNITPLTDLMVANATGKLPATWWGSTGPTDVASLTAASVEKALGQLRTALNLPALQTLDPRTAAFKAAPKDKVDDILEALQSALTTAGVSYSALLNEAAKAAFTLSSGFQLTLQTAYNTITIGGTGTGAGGTGTGGTGTGGGASGNYTLTIDVNAGGVAVPAVTITNMAKPANQSEFCDQISSSNSDIGLSQSIPTDTGKLTINSCSFNGTTGQVSTTVSITSPVAITLPYSITYNYR